tara:strand:+ start:347 stop:523 length:177 start_codon:yes stop_codon:yes gene_type:complete
MLFPWLVVGWLLVGCCLFLISPSAQALPAIKASVSPFYFIKTKTLRIFFLCFISSFGF